MSHVPGTDEMLPCPPQRLHGPNSTPNSNPVRMFIINRERQHKYSHSGGIRTAPVRAPLPLLRALNLVRVGRAALVGIAVPASAGGVVLGRGGGALVRVVMMGDAVGEGTEFVAVARRVVGVVAEGAYVARATAAGELYQIRVSDGFSGSEERCEEICRTGI